MTTPSVMTNWWGNAIWLHYLFTNGAWVGLHTGDPGITGDLSTEVIGGGYIRQQALFRQPQGKTLSNLSKITFPGMPVVTIRYVSLNMSQISGHMYCSVQLDDPVDITADAHYIIPASDLALTL